MMDLESEKKMLRVATIALTLLQRLLLLANDFPRYFTLLYVKFIVPNPRYNLLYLSKVEFICQTVIYFNVVCQTEKVKVKSSLAGAPSGESTTTECRVNYGLLAVITEVAQWGTSSCSRPQQDTDNGVRDGRW